MLTDTCTNISTDAEGICFSYLGIERFIDFPGADELRPETVEQIVSEELCSIDGDWDDGSF